MRQLLSVHYGATVDEITSIEPLQDRPDDATDAYIVKLKNGGRGWVYTKELAEFLFVGEEV
jgi:hypothetical protein